MVRNEWLFWKMCKHPRVSMLLLSKCCQCLEVQRCRVTVLQTAEEEAAATTLAPGEAPWPTGALLWVIPGACWRRSKKCDSGPSGFLLWLPLLPVRQWYCWSLAPAWAACWSPAGGDCRRPAKWMITYLAVSNCWGDALWGAPAAFQSSFQDSFSLKVVSYFHAPVFGISMFQPLIMTCLGTTLAVKDWISLNVFLSNQKSFWSEIWCTDR